MQHLHIIPMWYSKLWNPIYVSIRLSELFPLFITEIFFYVRIIVPVFIYWNECICLIQRSLTQYKIRIFPGCYERIYCIVLILSNKPGFLTFSTDLLCYELLYIIIRIYIISFYRKKSRKMLYFFFIWRLKSNTGYKSDKQCHCNRCGNQSFYHTMFSPYFLLFSLCYKIA